ncbi:MAG: hypothetical protein E7458_00890 [Ruminococcaceae bacterium]|nr:hypothetical protein [Oscillospiraceae bacterium]
MAKLEYTLRGDFDEILRSLEDAVMDGSATASREDASDFSAAAGRVAVRVYERYSWSGSSRVSMNLTLAELDGRIFLSVITSGGSQAMYFKVNTWGESAFLDTIRRAAEAYRA